jgi:hypothetical protein
MLEGTFALFIAKLIGGIVAAILILLGVNFARRGGFPFSANDSSKKDQHE